MFQLDVFNKNWTILNMIREIGNKINDVEIEITEWGYEKVEYQTLESYKTIEKGKIIQGDRWDENYTYFFYNKFITPRSLHGKNIYLLMDIGGESEVYVNKKALGSIDFAHRDVLISEKGVAGQILEITLQSSKHAQEFVKHLRLTGKPYPHHVFNKSKIISKNYLVEEYYYLCHLLLQIILIEEVRDKNLAEHLRLILKSNLMEVPFFEERSVFLKTIKEAGEKLKNEIKELNIPKKYGKALMMGHSHLDLVFKWPFKETLRKIERTISNTTNLLNRFPEVIYSQSQIFLIKTLEEKYPDLCGEFDRLVKEGRIEPVGNVWVEYDANIPSGESLIRQTLYSRKYLNSKGYPLSKVCFLPDTFGFSAILPQILKQCGYKYFVTTKLAWNDTNQFPYNYFLWEGIDGSQIKAHLMPLSYGGDVTFERITENVNKRRQKELNTFIYQYGAGDGGGGISEEMVKFKNTLKELNSFVELEDSTIENAVKEIDENIVTPPIYKGELYLETHRGVYTSQALIKKYNRKTEILYRNLELFSIIAKEKGIKYPHGIINKGWETILFNQFHDIIAGSIISEAVNDVLTSYKEIYENGEKEIDKTLSALIKDGQDILIFNPLAWKRNEVITVKVPLEMYNSGKLNKKACQLISEKESEVEVIIEINDIPPLGYKKVNLVELKPAEAYNFSFNHDNDRILENNLYRIEFNASGEMIRIFDKKHQREVLRGRGNYLEAFVDRPGYFESWDIAKDFELKRFDIKDVKEMKVIERGPYRWTMKVVKVFKQSYITQYISIYSNCLRIDIKTELDFYEKQILLKAGFELDIETDTADFDLSMGSIKRPIKRKTSIDKAMFEVFAHKWVDLSEGQYGVALLNDSKYGYDLKDNQLRVTLLKTATFPDPNQDIGHHEFVYSLMPHEGDFRGGKVVRAGYELNNPCYVKWGDVEVESYSWLKVHGENVILDTVKKAEDDQGIILRLYESGGTEEEVKLELINGYRKVELCTVLEDSIKELPIIDGQVELRVKPFEIVTIKLTK